MAYIETRKHPDGSKTYRVRIRRKGMPDKSETFPCKSKAQAWGRKMEGEVCDKRYFPRKENEEQTFAAFIDKYIELELPKKPKSYKKQRMQLLWWKQQLGDCFLVYVTNSMISELRDKLLSEKLPKGTKRTSSTTNRYLAALSHVYTVAVKDWGWVNENPVLKVRRPKENKAKEGFLEKHEIDLLLGECAKSKSPYIISAMDDMKAYEVAIEDEMLQHYLFEIGLVANGYILPALETMMIEHRFTEELFMTLC